MEQYNQHKEQEEQGNSITKENITPFINSLVDELIKYARDNLEFGKNLVEDFVMGTLDCEKPQKTTLEQQRVFAKINQEFSVNIKKFLPDYNRNVPKIDEYKIIIHKLCCSKKVQDFAQDYERHQTEVVRSREENHPGGELGEVQPISRDQSLGFFTF
ncbi:hypothetical protein GO685_02295 [Wolbachia endosymbiont of Madathamugadia hiepei]|uniref:hypothetical protein n=1 Tax=Wolbachia endosymbiont of Madathamugadia hiepei TaxID=1241303 RepID=UPI00158F0076|nr:hypothetical protein [Wolbachia endosymbiont of Madathamugadia hiepei]NUX01342.1 hypothetical protein [Wolbachia endosymbiont of Madathamugadia hiepei]